MSDQQFKASDKVRICDGTEMRVVKSEMVERVTVMHPSGHQRVYYADEVQKVEKSEQEIWMEAAMLIGFQVHAFRLPLVDTERRMIRHRAYTLLGNHIRITEEVKEQVRGLMEQAEQQQRDREA